MKICPSCSCKCADSTKYCPRCNRYLGGVNSVSEKEYYKNIQAQSESLSKPVPKCPTCSSTNIQKVSGTAKVAGALAFGLFSKTARSQFKCLNCGYKW